MTDEFRKHQGHPEELKRQFKLTGVDGLGENVYAEVLALEPGSIGGGGAGGGAVTIVDGGDTAQGTTTDAAWVAGAGTVISLLKKIASAGGSAVSIADGADVAQGTTTDTSAANTIVGILKAIKAAVQGTLAVSGTFWQAVQPVSGTFWQATQPVSGTFFQATQPVSLATNTPDVTDRAARLLGHVTVDAAPTTLVTQGTSPWVVSDNTNTRTNVSLSAEAVAGAAAEALITLSQSKGFAAPSTGTSYSVTAGKTLRLHAMVVAWVATTTTANTTRLRIRVNTAGAAIITSPVVYTARTAWESATFIANEGEFNTITFPGGIDIPSGSGVAITHLEAAANGTIDVTLIGYEF